MSFALIFLTTPLLIHLGLPGQLFCDENEWLRYDVLQKLSIGWGMY